MRIFILALLAAVILSTPLAAQRFEAGMVTNYGRAHTSFRGDLAKMVGFSEIEITEEQVDTALARFDLSAPRWLRELFPGVRIDVAGDISRKQTRNVKTVRFFARYAWLGGSFSVSDPRLTTPLESRKLGNQVKSVRLSLAGKSEELAQHLAAMALADETRTKPFFNNRYDLDVYIDFKRLIYPDQVLLEWGRNKNSTIDASLASGIRFTADPSPVVDLGNVLFISQKLDSLMEGGLLNPVENTTDQIAVAIQNVVFGKFRDPRVVPSLGWFLRGEVPVNFGGDFSVLLGGEFSINKHTSIKGTKPMTSAYGYAGVRWKVAGGANKSRRR
ncbi:MAG: hypothetical protein HUU34_17760 [Saprospiraceae bacterium]|nr:hypothetical protein [Saprospiraceae bacterium]